jgi:hypothetical protein
MPAFICRVASLALLAISGPWVSKAAALPFDVNTTVIDIPPSTQGINAIQKSGSAVLFQGCSDRQGQKLASFLADIPTLANTAATYRKTDLTPRYFGFYANWYDDYIKSKFSFPL